MSNNYVNTKQIYKLLLVALIFGLNLPLINSQNLDTPLNPVQLNIMDWELGGFVGIGANFSGGEYSAECPDCIFDDNSKFGWSLGLKTDYQISQKLYLGTNLIFDDLSARGSFRRFEDVQLQRADGTIMEVPIEFRHIGEYDIKAIGLTPNLLYRPAAWLDLRLGFFGDFILKADFSHTKELLTKTALLPDGEKVKVTIPNSNDNKVVIEDREIPELNAFQYGLFPQINFNIPVTADKNTNIILGYFMKIPLSDLSAAQSGYNHITWRFFFGLSFDLNEEGKTTLKPKDR